MVLADAIAARLAVDELVSALVPGVPSEELIDGHPNRNFSQHRIRSYNTDRG
jgi:hypothetical protein